MGMWCCGMESSFDTCSYICLYGECSIFCIILTINISVLLHCTIAITIIIIITNVIKFLLLPAYLNFLYCIHAAVHFIL